MKGSLEHLVDGESLGEGQGADFMGCQSGPVRYADDAALYAATLSPGVQLLKLFLHPHMWSMQEEWDGILHVTPVTYMSMPCGWMLTGR